MSAREMRAAVAVAVLIAAVSCLPYLAGYWLTPAGRVFGGFVLDEIDSNTYLAIMQQGARGQWTATLLYTPEDHPALVLYVFYLALGHLAAWVSLPLILIYHAARAVSAVILMTVLYLFICLHIESKRGRWIAYLLAATGSGAGLLVALLAGGLAPGGISPIDFWLMEGYVFFTLLLFPHSALSMACLLGVVGGMALAWEERTGWQPWLLALVGGLALSILNPYVIVIAGVILGAYWVLTWIVRRRLPWREGVMLAALAAAVAPPVAYYAHQFVSHPVWQSFLAQDVVPSPPVWYYVAGYGVIFVFALVGAWYVLRHRLTQQWLLVVWPVVTILVCYVPFSAQRRIVFGLMIPLAALAAIGLDRQVLPSLQRSRFSGWLSARGYARQRLANLVTALIIATASTSNLFLVASSVVSVATGHPDITQSAAAEEAIAWLGLNSSTDAVILSSYRVGNIIPARIGRRVVWGHWDKTAFYADKKADVATFFDADTSDKNRSVILRRYSVGYVLYGPSERALGGFEPDTAAFLQPVFRSGEVTVFKVVGTESR
jgi:hypothetical protein